MTMMPQGSGDDSVVGRVGAMGEELPGVLLDEVAAAIAEHIDRDDYIDGERFRLMIRGQEIVVTPGARVDQRDIGA